MSKIDIERLKVDAAYWDEVAPGGATYCEVMQTLNNRWWMHNYGIWRFWNGQFWSDPSFKPCATLISRPTKPERADWLPQWDGEECPPPIGSVCECTFSVEHHDTWHKGKVTYHGIDPEGREFFIVDTGTYQACYRSLDHVRPIRTESEKQRDELANLLGETVKMRNTFGEMADSILAKYNLTEK